MADDAIVRGIWKMLGIYRGSLHGWYLCLDMYTELVDEKEMELAALVNVELDRLADTGMPATLPFHGDSVTVWVTPWEYGGTAMAGVGGFMQLIYRSGDIPDKERSAALQ